MSDGISEGTEDGITDGIFEGIEDGASLGLTTSFTNLVKDRDEPSGLAFHPIRKPITVIATTARNAKVADIQQREDIIVEMLV